MIKDSLHQQIVQRLGGHIHPDLFEACACELLRADWPRLVPVPGGDDAGMDGAIADGKGEAFPLICTTGTDVIRNLTGSLASYGEKGGTRRKVVLVTSQALTARRRRNLETRAREKGFRLSQVYDQTAIATLLYRSPEWCKKLLALPGTLPALSAFPVTSRPMLNEKLVGRAPDLGWLRKTEGDKVLVGQPGSGKSFLLYNYCSLANGAFVARTDISDIADEVRETKPRVLFCDDALAMGRTVEELVHLRTNIGADFAIVATTWPGDEDVPMSVLNLSTDSVRQLEPLTRDEIVEIVRDAGVAGPDVLVREIVDQAEGRPGLAVTLAYVCRRSVVDLFRGDALLRSLKASFRRMVSPSALGILGHFALGDDKGVALNTVATALGLSEHQVINEMTKLAAGGVLTRTSSGFAVRPKALRHVLVRDVFFSSPVPHALQPLLDQVSDLPGVVSTLIGSRYAGASVDDALLMPLLERAASSECWGAYASLGALESTRVLDKSPDLIGAVSQPALHYVPEKAVRLLLGKAVGDNRPLNSQPDHPMRILGDWVKAAQPGTEEVIRRREALLDAALEWLRLGREQDVGMQALSMALSPCFETMSSDPGSGLRGTLTHGFITADDVQRVRKLWPKVAEVLREVRPGNWGESLGVIRDWTSQPAGRVGDKCHGRMRAFAREMLKTIVPLVGRHNGYLRDISVISRSLHLRTGVTVDHDFEVLFPEDRLRFASEGPSVQVTQLARKWAARPPGAVVKRVARLEKEAAESSFTPTGLTGILFRDMAQTASRPVSWVSAIRKSRLDAALVVPFLHRVVSDRKAKWRVCLRSCLQDTDYRDQAIGVILDDPSLFSAFSPEIETMLPDFVRRVRLSYFVRPLPVAVMASLLRHDDGAVAASAAMAEWEWLPRGQVREDLVELWGRAIPLCVDDSYNLSKILSTDGQLASAWLLARIAEGDHDLWRYEDVVTSAVAALGQEERRDLLAGLGTCYAPELVRTLVGNDDGLYRFVLGDASLRDQHLAPLRGHPDSVWARKALLALDAGYDAEDIAGAAYDEGQCWSGNESEMWREWLDSFSRLRKHHEPRLAPIVAKGTEIASAGMKAAQERERREAIYGIR